jgi:hypothetical protein
MQNDKELLLRLQSSRVDFVVIGGVCCVYHGVSMATFDLDICCPFDEANLHNLHSAVKDLHPLHRFTADKLPFELTPELLPALKNLYLQTDLGKIDCLNDVAGVGNFPKVRDSSIEGSLGFGSFRFPSLKGLIRAKEAVGRERDLQALIHLRAIEERISRNHN